MSCTCPRHKVTSSDPSDNKIGMLQMVSLFEQFHKSEVCFSWLARYHCITISACASQCRRPNIPGIIIVSCYSLLFSSLFLPLLFHILLFQPFFAAKIIRKILLQLSDLARTEPCKEKKKKCKSYIRVRTYIHAYSYTRRPCKHTTEEGGRAISSNHLSWINKYIVIDLTNIILWPDSEKCS